MINSLKTFFILVVLLHMNIVSANNNKIVYIDMDFLINNSKVGKSLSLQISKLNESNKKNIDNLENEIKKEDKLISEQKNILSETEIKEKVKVLNTKIKNYQNQLKLNRNFVNENRLKATAKLIESLRPILSDYSKENSISLVLQKKDIIMGKNELNITSDIIKILDETVKKIDIN